MLFGFSREVQMEAPGVVTQWLTAGCNRPPASRVAAEATVRYAD